MKYVVFISTVKFRINAMYMGRVPVTKHGARLSGSTLTAGYKKIFGGTGEEIFEFS